MKELWKKKEYIVLGIVVVLFGLVSYVSLSSIHQMRGNARVVNYAGIVRGATQRLVKKELQGYPDDALILRLDSIVDELISGEGKNNLVALPDEEFQGNMAEVRRSWMALKEEIAAVRAGKEDGTLFDMSEAYFALVDRTVSSAEAYSETQVSRSTGWLMGVDAAFVVLILMGGAGLLRSAALKRRADALGKIAYVDPLTQMPNRASCERELDTCAQGASAVEMAVYMFDMNNLKRVNDLLGHQGGDRIIADFARILKTESAGYGFVGRYGGDEFVALFPDCDQDRAERYLTQVNEKVIAYNLLHVHAVEKISFAVGYVIGSPAKFPIEDMVNEADRKMYVRKRQMKENKED